MIHNDTRGPQHGPANAAVRPDRDHGFGRIYRIQHKEAKRLEVPALDRGNLDGLVRAMETSPNAHVKMLAWRLARENHGSSPRLQQAARPMGSPALAVYERARLATSAAERRAQLDIFARATDDWTRSAIVAAATRRASAYVAEAFTHEQPQALVQEHQAVQLDGNVELDRHLVGGDRIGVELRVGVVVEGLLRLLGGLDERHPPVALEVDLEPLRGKTVRLTIRDDQDSEPYGYIGVTGFDLITSYNGP